MGEDSNMNLEEHTFQEQTRYKLAISAFIACIGMMCLGFGLSFAGQSDAARIAAENSSGEVEDSNTALSSGYGNILNIIRNITAFKFSSIHFYVI